MIHESWSKALLAAESVEEHAHALVSGLGSLGQKAAMAPEQAKKLAAELAERMQTHRKAIAGDVERAVKTAVGHIRLPARADLAAMSEKLAALEARLGELERGERTTDRKESK